jgi:hypothetical protein
MPLVFATAAVGIGLAWAGSARADGYRLQHTIPREVIAYDYTTGGEFMAPPVPYGHYAKDHAYGPGALLACASCRLHGLLGCIGCGHEGGGSGCNKCGGHGCGLCLGHGKGHGGDPGCSPGCGGHGHHHKAGRFAPCDSGTVVAGGTVIQGPYAGPGTVVATNQSIPSGQAVVTGSPQDPCGVAGCGMSGHHSHHRRLCGRCGGKGCRGCGGHGSLAGCGDPGCGLCRGKGNGCSSCGGKGCSHCMGALSGLHGRLAGLLHHGPKVDYFVGAGGPVPLTPGYVPYIVATRSPRDFFSFPPMNPFDP